MALKVYDSFHRGIMTFLKMDRPDPIMIFNALSAIPLKCTDKSEAFKEITELGRQALQSHACTLAEVDLPGRWLIHRACAGLDKAFEQSLINKELRLGSVGNGDLLDFDLFAKGELIEKYNLIKDGQGIANPTISERYGLYSALCYPLKIDERLIGYFNHFSSKKKSFTNDQKRLLEIFARQAVVTIDRFDRYKAQDELFESLRSLTQSLLKVSPADYFEQVAQKARILLSADVCLLWMHVEQEKKLKIVATAGRVDEKYKFPELSFENPYIRKHLKHKRVKFILDVSKSTSQYLFPEDAQKKGWVSLLSAPLETNNHIIGMIDLYTKIRRNFKSWEKECFGTFADYAAVSIHKADLLREAEANLQSKNKLMRLSILMRQMTEATDERSLLDLIVKEGSNLVPYRHAAIYALDLAEGKLKVVATRDNAHRPEPLMWTQGSSGKSLSAERPIRVGNVFSEEWKDIYVPDKDDTRSELAVPILITNAKTMDGRGHGFASKPIGVFDVESEKENAFSHEDENILWLIAQQASLLIDRIKIEAKIISLRKMKEELVGKKNLNDIFEVFSKGVTESLGYDYVNISLVDSELSQIKSSYVVGIPEKDKDEFKSKCVHSLDGNDIQADIVRNKCIEVPGEYDERYDAEIYAKFNHKDLIRVFVPMISPRDERVIGTVEAGYRNRECRRYIYKRDVDILWNFIEFTVRALEQRERVIIDKITHEFRAPIVGIRSNASFLQRRLKDLETQTVDQKFEDIIADSHILLYQVKELEHILGGAAPIYKKVTALIFRDIIIKTINQLKPLVTEKKFDSKNITWRHSDIRKIEAIYVDKASLNQVVYNLLTNSIKYASDNSEEFAIHIEVDETRDNFIIKFKDWGIGVSEGLEEKIFEDGFRSPDAIEKHVSGSGLGITIARKIMREMGGDLVLANNFKPTEFHMILPKSIQEK